MPPLVSNVVKVGDTFGRWTVIRREPDVGLKIYWLCRCECGTERPVYQASLRNRRSRSCGCLKREVQAARHTKHGGHRSPTYKTWESMISRCYNQNNAAYPGYGGRGITVCDRWHRSYAAFLEDMGERPRGHSIDRVDNDGDYEPGNCRWASNAEQARNRSVNRYIEHDGLRLTMMDWSTRLGIPFGALRNRIDSGWGVADALTTPVSRHNSLRYKDPNRKAITLTLNGETATVAEWSRRTGIQPATLIARHRQGWSDEEALTTPVRPMRRSV